MAVYAIGDIQGCYADLQNLLELISYSEQNDKLYFVGDLVNRGPQSLEVLRFLRQIPNCKLVLGNHDIHLIARYLGAVKAGRRDTLDDILAAADAEELMTWLRAQPLLIHDADLKLLIVHAGLSPQWDLATAKACALQSEKALRQGGLKLFSHLYGDMPDYWSEDLKSWDRLRYSINCFTRLRFCDAQGRLILDKKAGPARHANLTPWYQLVDLGLDIIFGHWSTLGLYQHKQVYCIDSGCLWGGKLTALQLDSQPYQVYSVDCSTHVKPIGL